VTRGVRSGHTGFLFLVLALVMADGSVANAVEPQGGVPFAPLMTIGSPFGQHSNLTGAMNASGEVKLVWRSTIGDANKIQAAAIAPGATEASSASTLSSDEPLTSEPVLAYAPGGRAAVGWFDERATQQVDGDELLALDVRDQASGAGWEAPRTVWRPAHRAGYSFWGLAVGVDQRGDEVVAWMTRRQNQAIAERWTIMVSSRRANGSFTTPTTLATVSVGVPPAVAMSANGEATVLWCGPEDRQQILASTWPAGNPPSSPTILDQVGTTEPPTSPEHFSDLHIQVDASGDEIATWLNGIDSSDRPEVVALRAAWRRQGAAFSAPQTVTSAGVEAREPVVALSPDHRALIAWSEITSDGSGPELNYATAPVGASFTAGSPIIAALGEHPELQDAWLPDGSALMLWRGGGGLLADHWTPGGIFPASGIVARLGEGESALLAAGGASAPVIAWIGRSPLDSAAEAVRYMVANGVDGSAHEDIAPVLRLAGSKNIVGERGAALASIRHQEKWARGSGEMLGRARELAPSCGVWRSPMVFSL
jgi:hypothetical protein